MDIPVTSPISIVFLFYWVVDQSNDTTTSTTILAKEAQLTSTISYKWYYTCITNHQKKFFSKNVSQPQSQKKKAINSKVLSIFTVQQVGLSENVGLIFPMK